MPQRHNVLVSLATYNEIDNLPRVVEQVRQAMSDVDIYVVDDNSPDGTGRWCEQRCKTDAHFYCLHRDRKLGLGTAAIAGMLYAIDKGYEFLVNLDADCSHHPKYLPSLLDRMDADPPVDVAIASRYVSGGGVRGWPLHRRWMSRCVNLYARTMLSLKPRDCSGSFRCYRVSKLRQVDLLSIRSQGYSFYEEILWHLQHVAASMDEVPYVFVDREHGQTKINTYEAIRAIASLLIIGVSRWFRAR